MAQPEAESVVMNVVRAGLWCEECLLPAAVEIDVVTMDEQGAQVIITLEGCRRCGTGVCSDEQRD